MTIKTQHNARGGTPPPAIALSGISKTFGAVRANDDIALTVTQGHIHGIVGENGAGKSTLVSILYGFYQADRGNIEINGARADIKTTADAIKLGVGMVHQHFMLVPTFTVLENIILGHEHRKGGKTLDDEIALAREELSSLAQQYGLDVDFDALVADLSVGLQQRVEILKTLYRGAKILILDEPTGVLTPQETDQLFEILATLRQQGVTVLLITHKLREIMAITDDVSVMRGGKMVAHLVTKTSPSELAELMVGRQVLINADFHDAVKGEVCLTVDNLTLTGYGGIPLLRGISFDLRAGEILGVAGVSGNGQSQLLEVLSGITPPTTGVINIGGQVISPESITTPHDVKNMGMAHVPEDRHAMGMVLPFSAAETSVLGYEDQAKLGQGIWFGPDQLERHCGELMEDYDIRPADPRLKCNLFSGGNQQKLVLAREMSAAPKILLVGQPTRGVDIGAIEFIYQRLIAMRDQGCAILLVSVELDEILTLSDRVMVMNNGASMGIVDKKDADAQSIGLMMAGGVMSTTLPRWIDIGVLPLLNILAAFIVSGIIIAIIGENPFTALGVMLKGAFVYKGALGYTLFYTTNFIFTGLAVAVAFHATLFNIGGEGQAMMGGLGIGLLVLALDAVVPAFLLILLAIPVSALLGAAWGAVPGYLQAKRGSHVVITTIMFNFIASSIMVWLLAGTLMEKGQMAPETRDFAEGVGLFKFHEIAGMLGIKVARSPLNLSFVIALIAAFGVWVLIWRTRLGYVIRATGHSEKAAVYAGHSPQRIIIITMAISGGLAGMMALNEILGVQHKLILDFTSGFGFTGIAVALMGRNHPVGIIFASLLFGALYQGGAELDFEFRTITREMVLMIQGLIILFSGALVYMFNPMVERLYHRIIGSEKGAA